MAHAQQSTQIKSHETGVAGHHDPVGLAIGIDQTGRGVGCERIDRFLLL